MHKKYILKIENLFFMGSFPFANKKQVFYLKYHLLILDTQRDCKVACQRLKIKNYKRVFNIGIATFTFFHELKLISFFNIFQYTLLYRITLKQTKIFLLYYTLNQLFFWQHTMIQRYNYYLQPFYS